MIKNWENWFQFRHATIIAIIADCITSCWVNLHALSLLGILLGSGEWNEMETDYANRWSLIINNSVYLKINKDRFPSLNYCHLLIKYFICESYLRILNDNRSWISNISKFPQSAFKWSHLRVTGTKRWELKFTRTSLSSWLVPMHCEMITPKPGQELAVIIWILCQVLGITAKEVLS